MSKLLRLTTQDPRGYFDNDLNQDLTIESNSKIALVNMSAEIDMNVITVNSENEEIQYQLVATEGQKSIFIDNKTYNKFNFNELYDDIQLKLNVDMSILPSNIGRQWQVGVDTNNIVEFKIGRGAILKPETVSQEDVIKKILVRKVPATTTTYGRNIASGTVGTADSFIYSTVPNAKGTSILRGRIAQSTQSSGCIIGYVLNADRPVGTTTLIDLTKIKYGVKFTRTTTSEDTYYYSKIIDGVETLTDTPVRVYADSGTDIKYNDYIDIQTLNGKIQGMVYADLSVSEPMTYTLFTQPYDHTIDLFPVIIFLGNETAQLRDIEFSRDPFYTPDGLEKSPTFNDELIETPLHNEPPPHRASNNNIFLNIVSVDLAKFIGFNRSRQPATGTFKSGSLFTFRADNSFELTDLSDSYIIELMNITVDSYDTLSKQRSNIIHVVVNPNITEEKVSYIAPYPLYVSLKNQNPMTLRNIKARILNEDLSQVSLSGFSMITLLIN
jgi:hypothetical protein